MAIALLGRAADGAQKLCFSARMVNGMIYFQKPLPMTVIDI
jgi:hypothetical protein